MASYKELQEQITALTAQAEALRQQEVGKVIEDIRAKMADYGLTTADIAPKGTRGLLKGATIAPKYIDRATGQTWSGRGKQPRWMVEALARGATMETLKI